VACANIAGADCPVRWMRSETQELKCLPKPQDARQMPQTMSEEHRGADQTRETRGRSKVDWCSCHNELGRR
jgi:hypothetical protein